ncbi:pyridoxal phosphate-dependent decarboxylase family protein [Actinocrispum wychmicini]|uniref:Glutamate/tyrosine decarboxylase-like PLP-dependent enzyme n=1 Tax=Actinocrispum wychmicini TaxID=1213861 RepID=A0A4R2JX66_9PSEU|nr:pyridoxal-dependent decarboxylase [Actinocrispum wychmicini]TCO61978.1 glutamate/tyrosine decarboxylase-like PLP-dependent enzyme [Actinocrispum wychmicini]
MAVEPSDFRRELLRAANWVADYLDAVPSNPVARPLPTRHRRRLSASPLRDNGRPLAEFLDFVDTDVAPYPGGNGHPAFFAWITTPPAPIGIIADLIGCALNASCGYGENALVDMERGAVRALAELAGLPAGTGGVLTSGGSMANLLCLAAARTWFLTARAATDGDAYDHAHARLVCYQSTETHMSVGKAARTIGLPPSRIRNIPVTADLRMDTDRLRAAVEADRAAGLLPFCVVSTLGTVGTGAVDPVAEVTRLCREHGMWHHGDGAYGGLGAVHPDLAAHYGGMAELDSLTVDPHKTLNVPISCGAALVANADSLRAAFSTQASYLDGNDEWPWLSEYTLELTRPSGRALSVWAVLHQLGRQGVVDLLDHYLRHARLLRELISEHPDLHLVTGGPWAITCFRYLPQNFTGDADVLTAHIAQQLQARGKAFLATVRVHGNLTLRASVCGHRTTKADIETLLAEVLHVGSHLTMS